MHAVELTIGEHVHRLPMDADEDAVVAELTAAVQAGGGVVLLPTPRAGATVAVLISPGVPVFIERTPIPTDGSQGVGAAVGDWDDWAEI
ncbi:hypothetical protein AAIB33_10820 [Microbacterium sp. AZCO]|uniref:hypothetical protein n=1 Tax=Microbacterium sp. AZCO TaxID=3142976 RepID=UPI0031F46CE0